MKPPRLEINEPRYEVRVNGKEIPLAAKEYDILLLLKKTNVVMTREELFNKVWVNRSEDFEFESRNVDQHICRLRKKLGDSFIKTVPNRGYKFAAIP